MCSKVHPFRLEPGIYTTLGGLIDATQPLKPTRSAPSPPVTLRNRIGLSKGGFPMSSLIVPAVNYQVNFAIQYMKKGHKLVY